MGYVCVILFMCVFVAVLCLCCLAGLSLVVVSGVYSLVVTCRFPVAVASLVAERGL